MALLRVTSALHIARSLAPRKLIPAANMVVPYHCNSSRSSSNFTDKIAEGIQYMPKRGRFESGSRPPHKTDVLIVGGGAMGSSIAYHLTKAGVKVLVVERDPTYSKASTTRSLGGIRQQFSVKSNVLMSMYSVEFIKKIKEHLSVEGSDPPDVQFKENGYLFLASQGSADQMLENHRIQKECGACVELLAPRQLGEKFPWLSLDSLALGSFGVANEGWFDPWLLLKAFKEKALSLGATYVQGEVSGFNVRTSQANVKSARSVETVMVQLPNCPEIVPIQCSTVVIAAGPYSGEVAELLDIGKGSKEDLLDVGVPVCPRKRYVYVIHAPDAPGSDSPLVGDVTGVYCRPDGTSKHFLCGRAPLIEEDEPCVDNLDVDYEFFDQVVWPQIAHRIPALENMKVKSAWAGYYDFNTLDENAIIGTHPAYSNLYLATGFSGHGIQQSPAVGLAISDLFLNGKFCTLDLSDLSFDRVIKNQPIREKNIY